jgi:hypothetical protein
LIAQDFRPELARDFQRDGFALIPPLLSDAECRHLAATAGRAAARVDDPALAGWSRKEGAWYVQPPVALLEQLVAVRVHLDECRAEDGALRVLAGSHAGGRVEPADAASMFRSQPSTLCALARGGAMVMRPLLLHASSKATGSSRRRVLHFLFGPAALPFGLRWAQR